MADYEAELREGVQKRFGLNDQIGDRNEPSDESLEKRPREIER
jgi:hypothetical protein